MSTFQVPVVRINAIEPIPNADAIELAVIGDYRSVVRKGQYVPGMLVTYLPEQAVLPVSLIETLGLVGKLSGSQRNRIRAIRLRGQLSQGIIFDVPEGLSEGDDASEILGVVKYEPPVPGSMSGQVVGARGEYLNRMPKYDIENYKAHPWLISDGEEVEFTEKVHGTLCGISRIPGLDDPNIIGGDVLVFSKGLGAKGFVFADSAENESNIYLRIAKSFDMRNGIMDVFDDQEVHLFGEIYGDVQDLKYGKSGLNYALFDIYLGSPGNGRYLNRDELAASAERLIVDRVPVLYRGPFSRDVMMKYTDGQTIIGNGAHIREGIVVTPVIEREDRRHGRVILKSVSGDYLTRKGEVTEFN